MFYNYFQINLHCIVNYNIFVLNNNEKKTIIMKASDLKVGLEVVRSVGDYVVGRTGTIIAIDEEKGRAQVGGENWGVKTWVSHKALEPVSIPYTIVRPDYTKKPNPRTGRYPYPQYKRV